MFDCIIFIILAPNCKSTFLKNRIMIHPSSFWNNIYLSDLQATVEHFQLLPPHISQIAKAGLDVGNLPHYDLPFLHLHGSRVVRLQSVICIQSSQPMRNLVFLYIRVIHIFIDWDLPCIKIVQGFFQGFFLASIDLWGVIVSGAPTGYFGNDSGG